MTTSYMMRRALCCLLAACLVGSSPAQAPPDRKQGDFTIRVTSDLVLVNVVARDRRGNLVRDLKPEEFTVQEDGKAHTLQSFDIENTQMLAVAPAERQQAEVAGAFEPEPAPAAAAEPAQFKNHRLIVLFFDFSGMEPEEIERAAAAAQRYVEQQMTPADLIAVASFSNDLQVNLDFTPDRESLRRTLAAFRGESGEGFTAETAEGMAASGSAYAYDDAEFASFNADRKLRALESLVTALGHIQQKKSIIYFSNGVSSGGLDNQTQLRATVNAAIRANVSIYAMDARGLQAIPPGGGAEQASLRGTGMFSGRSVAGQFQSVSETQDTLAALAKDTGGRAFFDTNDFSRVFAQVQQDTESYYVLGYRTTNLTEDGRFRRITVKTSRPGVRLEYRNGYHAPRDFAHSTRQGREEQLTMELASELGSTELRVYLAAAYFRVSNDQFFVPVSVVVPGSEIPFLRAGDSERTTLDVIGQVRDSGSRLPVGSVRDTVRLNLDESQQVRRKNVQYTTAFVLAPGEYRVKIVVRENQTGKMGSFEADLVIPDLRREKQRLRMSSVVLGSQFRPAARGIRHNVLASAGQELVPNITHVFSADQKMYLYYEVYDPARAAASSEGESPRRGGRQSVRVLSSVQFFDGRVKVFETPLVEVRELNDRRAAVFQLEVPLAQLPPGQYICQINVIDDGGGTFLFPRFPILVRGAEVTTAATEQATPAPAASLPARQP